MISDRFDDFSQSLRVFIEQKIKLQGLLLVDADEAVGNIELACKSMLDTFASLYDAARSSPKVDFDFYASPLCCCVLAYRNAKHHNNACGIRSVYRYAQQNEREDYLLVDFPAGDGEEGGGFIDHYVSWGDFCALLDMPRSQNRLRSNSRQLIRSRIGADEFERFAKEDNVPVDRVFINIIPIIIGAGTEFMPHLKSQVSPQSVEAKHFVFHFEEVEQANFSEPEYMELTSAVFSKG